MKVASASADSLVLSDTGAPLRVTGLIALAIGSAFAFAAYRSGVPGVMFGFFAIVLLAGGIAGLVLPQRVTVVFDRAAHTVRISRRSLRGSTLDEIDFNKITAVVAESPPTSRSAQATWRVCIVLRDGARVPLTSYYVSGTSQFDAAAAASKFLGLAPAPAEGPAAPGDAAAPKIPVRRPPSKFVFALMTVFCLTFIGIGTRLLWLEWHRLAVAQPVRAYVISTDVKTIHGSGRSSSVSYKPVVIYNYSVNGRAYSGNSVTPLNESRSGHWAFDLVAKYRVGDSVTAWYDPAHPEQAFLDHEWSFMPVMFIGFAMVFLTAVWFMFKKAGMGARPTTTA